MSAASVRQGDVLAGRYRVDRVIGAGAMGVVVAATDLTTSERCAVKLMRPGAIGDRVTVARFLREARATARIRGPHVAHVLDVGRLESGAPFMVMELLEGQDLRTVLEARGALPVGEALTIVLQACEALAEAHEKSVVHRDLKPANLFLIRQPDGATWVKVLDFGVSKILGDTGSSGDTTRSNTMLGSPHYMSPEQMRSSRDVDTRTDVWSLGVVAYQILTGRVPFEGKGLAQIVAAVLQGNPEPPSRVVKGLPPALDAAILRCLESDRERRCASVIELAASLAPFAPSTAAASLERLLGVRAQARETGRRRKRKGRRRVPTAVLLAAAFALGGTLAFLFLRLR